MLCVGVEGITYEARKVVRDSYIITFLLSKRRFYNEASL